MTVTATEAHAKSYAKALLKSLLKALLKLLGASLYPKNRRK